jgi:hypothetical protein
MKIGSPATHDFPALTANVLPATDGVMVVDDAVPSDVACVVLFAVLRQRVGFKAFVPKMPPARTPVVPW